MIFNLLKSKPTLKELIPNDFVDIHSHILPGIDDGAKNVKESLKLISEMKKLGFSKIIGTPHTYPGLYDNNNESIKNSFQKLKNQIINNDKIFYASEYYAGRHLIELIEKKKILALKKSYVLIELSFNSESFELLEIIFKLKTNNYTPILAHPERYLYFFENFEKFYDLKNYGCLFQLNLPSITGYYGKKVAELSNKLLSQSLIDFVGSDIHNLSYVNEFYKKVIVKEIGGIETAIENNSKIFD